jgi:hypothetical protein
MLHSLGDQTGQLFCDVLEFRLLRWRLDHSELLSLSLLLFYLFNLPRHLLNCVCDFLQVILESRSDFAMRLMRLVEFHANFVKLLLQVSNDELRRVLLVLEDDLLKIFSMIEQATVLSVLLIHLNRPGDSPLKQALMRSLGLLWGVN